MAHQSYTIDVRICSDVLDQRPVIDEGAYKIHMAVAFECPQKFQDMGVT